MFFTWLKTLELVYLFGVTICKAPTLYPYSPIFLAKDWATNMSKPFYAKYLIAETSFIRSPLANPWYAASKNGISFFFYITSDILCQSSFVGSTPVGLWAHACNRKTLPSWVLFKNSRRELILTFFVTGS